MTYRNIWLKNVRQCILVGVGNGKSNDQNATGITPVSNILFHNVRCDVGTTSSYDLTGQNRSVPITNMTFVNVTMGAGVEKQASCRDVECTCDALTLPCPTCCKRLAALP